MQRYGQNLIFLNRKPFFIDAEGIPEPAETILKVAEGFSEPAERFLVNAEIISELAETDMLTSERFSKVAECFSVKAATNLLSITARLNIAAIKTLISMTTDH